MSNSSSDMSTKDPTLSSACLLQLLSPLLLQHYPCQTLPQICLPRTPPYPQPVCSSFCLHYFSSIIHVKLFLRYVYQGPH